VGPDYLSSHDRDILLNTKLFKEIINKYVRNKLIGFFNEDKTIKKLLNVQKHSDHMYTSKLINTQEITQKLKLISKEISSIKIPDND
ncbi:24377_t:CDS:1, partial [Racocetra persica]